MSCYLRYMKEVLNEANLHPETREERKEIDLTIRGVIQMNPEDKCNIVWREVKLWLQDDDKKAKLISTLKK